MVSTTATVEIQRAPRAISAIATKRWFCSQADGSLNWLPHAVRWEVLEEAADWAMRMVKLDTVEAAEETRSRMAEVAAWWSVQETRSRMAEVAAWWSVQVAVSTEEPKATLLVDSAEAIGQSPTQ